MQRLLIIALIVVVFVGFMVTYTVRFTEKAVVTTFGRADERSVKTEPGLRFKIPYIQQVTKYDSRARYLETNQETQQTADDSQILVTAYMTWQVDDPLKFFKKFSAAGDSEKDHYRAAENTLKTKLRSAMGEVSRFQFGQLLSPDEKASKLSELEANILRNMEQTAGNEGALSDLGIKAKSVGISRIGLPQNTTRAVFARMNEERKKIADQAISQGQAEADSLRSSAEADKRKIESFADRLSLDIRRQGEIEAAEWIKQMRSNPQLAVFLRNMEFLRNAQGTTTTLVLPTSLPGFEFFSPGALKDLKAGQIPGPNFKAMEKSAAEMVPSDPAPAKKPASSAIGSGEEAR